MKVGELKILLDKYDEEMEVFVRHPSHDYWKNQLASSFDSDDVDIGCIQHSEYHRQFIVPSEDREYDEDKEVKEVLVISV